MLFGAAISILITMALALFRARRGPTVFDRILALNMFGTKTVLLIAVIGFLTDRPEFLDVGLLYALMNFIGMIALLRFSKYGHFADQTDPLTSVSGSVSGEAGEVTS